MYPQYWSWRLTGNLSSEISSIGCHTDLWAPSSEKFSSLVVEQSWSKLFPHLQMHGMLLEQSLKMLLMLLD